VHALRWPANHRAAIRPPPEFAVAPPQSARAPLPYRRCTDEYGRNGGLPVKYAVFLMPLWHSLIRTRSDDRKLGFTGPLSAHELM
jgi:hypothetical protein